MCIRRKKNWEKSSECAIRIANVHFIAFEEKRKEAFRDEKEEK